MHHAFELEPVPSLKASVRPDKLKSSGPHNQVVALPPGSDVVDWLYHNVEGFTDRREARKYASNLLKAGFIRHTVNKITFSEQCYYIFGDLCGSTCLPHLLALSSGWGWGDTWGCSSSLQRTPMMGQQSWDPSQGLRVLW